MSPLDPAALAWAGIGFIALFGVAKWSAGALRAWRDAARTPA